jgi:hypothetical protein
LIVESLHNSTHDFILPRARDDGDTEREVGCALDIFSGYFCPLVIKVVFVIIAVFFLSGYFRNWDYTSRIVKKGPEIQVVNENTHIRGMFMLESC